MKQAGLWIGVAALVLVGAVMVASALSVHDLYPVAEEPVVYEHDPKLHKMMEDEQHHQQREIYKVEFEYLTGAAVEFSIAALLAGKALRH